jgi:hypothetical protein
MLRNHSRFTVKFQHHFGMGVFWPTGSRDAPAGHRPWVHPRTPRGATGASACRWGRPLGAVQWAWVLVVLWAPWVGGVPSSFVVVPPLTLAPVNVSVPANTNGVKHLVCVDLNKDGSVDIVSANQGDNRCGSRGGLCASRVCGVCVRFHRESSTFLCPLAQLRDGGARCAPRCSVLCGLLHRFLQ